MGLRNPLFVAVAAGCAILIAACGGGMQAPPTIPIFTSTPGTTAAEGTVYTYQVAATDPAGGAVSFTLGNVPARATLSGNTLTWTPTPQESRVANSFAITATTAKGGTANQTWSVTPAGTVHITRVVTNWTATGSVSTPFDWTQNSTAAAEVAALVPQSDGTFQTLSGTGNSDGTFTIANVPAGYYWLRISPRATYWTSSTNFDFGTDMVGRTLPTAPSQKGNTFQFNINGLDPWQDGDSVVAYLDNGFEVGAEGPISAGATSMNAQASFVTNADFTMAQSAVVAQAEPIQIGSLNAMVLGPTLQLSNLSLINGGLNTFTGTLIASPKFTFSLDVNGSDWANLYNNAGPVAATPYDTSFNFMAQPYFTNGMANNVGVFESVVPPLISSSATFSRIVTSFQVPDTPCDSAPLLPTDHGFPPLMGQPPILTDQNLGSFQYGDPFPQEWLRAFSFCQEAVVNVPGTGSDSPVIVVLTDGLTTTMPTGSVTPLVSAVRNPTINGQSLFTANTLNTASVNLSWTAPTDRTSPTGYRIEIFTKTTEQIPGPPIWNPHFPPVPGQPVTVTTYATFGRIFTTKTNATLPYFLPVGQNFVVVITSLVDGRANFETSPLRTGLPEGNASVVSALMTMNGVAPALVRGKGIKFKPTPLVGPVQRDVHSRQIIILKQQ